MELVRNGGEQLIHDALEWPKRASEGVLGHAADAHAWTFGRVSGRQPFAIDVQQAHVHPEAGAAEVQTVVPDHWRVRRRSLVSHMACNVKTKSRAINARMAMSRNWVSTGQSPTARNDSRGTRSMERNHTGGVNTHRGMAPPHNLIRRPGWAEKVRQDSDGFPSCRAFAVVAARTGSAGAHLGGPSSLQYGAAMARVVLPGDIALERRRLPRTQPTRAAKPAKGRPTGVPGSACALCGAVVGPDGDGHDPACWGMA